MNKANSKTIGAFVVGAVALAISIIVFFGSGNIFAPKFEYVIYFRGDVDGLDTGAPVKLRGVQLGTVKKITPIFTKDRNFYVEVIIQTLNHVIQNVEDINTVSSQDQQLEHLIKNGFRAQLVTQSMVTGKLYIRVDYFPDTEVIKLGLNDKYPEIPSIKTLTEEIEDDLLGIVESISKIEFDKISDNLNRTLEGTADFLDENEINQTLIAFKNSMIAVEKLTAKIDNTLGPLSGDIREGAKVTKQTLKDIQTFVKHLDQVTLNNKYEIQQMIKQLSATTRAVRDLSDYLQRHPDAIIYGKD